MFFYDKLSLYFLRKREFDEPVENLKEMFDRSKDIIGLKEVMKKIFSFENYVWVSNQTYK